MAAAWRHERAAGRPLDELNRLYAETLAVHAVTTVGITILCGTKKYRPYYHKLYKNDELWLKNSNIWNQKVLIKHNYFPGSTFLLGIFQIAGVQLINRSQNETPESIKKSIVKPGAMSPILASDSCILNSRLLCL